MSITLDLPPSLEQQLNMEAMEKGIAVEEVIKTVLHEHYPTADSLTPGQSILQMAAKLRACVPEEEMDKIPSDLSVNYKHYLYGSPKVTD